MNILYGVQTTGNGHISRSREVIRELKKLGHDVQVILSGNKPAMLSDLKEFEPYQRFEGLTFCTNRGKLNYFKTALSLHIIQFYHDIASFDDSGCDLVDHPRPKQKLVAYGIGLCRHLAQCLTKEL